MHGVWETSTECGKHAGVFNGTGKRKGVLVQRTGRCFSSKARPVFQFKGQAGVVFQRPGWCCSSKGRPVLLFKGQAGVLVQRAG